MTFFEITSAVDLPQPAKKYHANRRKKIFKMDKTEIVLGKLFFLAGVGSQKCRRLETKSGIRVGYDFLLRIFGAFVGAKTGAELAGSGQAICCGIKCTSRLAALPLV